MSQSCKNCKMWRRFQGIEPTIPARTPNACVLRLRQAKTKAGENVIIPSLFPMDAKGPHWGKRTRPGFVCKYHVPTDKPYVKPKED